MRRWGPKFNLVPLPSSLQHLPWCPLSGSGSKGKKEGDEVLGAQADSRKGRVGQSWRHGLTWSCEDHGHSPGHRARVAGPQCPRAAAVLSSPPHPTPCLLLLPNPISTTPLFFN